MKKNLVAVENTQPVRMHHLNEAHIPGIVRVRVGIRHPDIRPHLIPRVQQVAVLWVVTLRIGNVAVVNCKFLVSIDVHKVHKVFKVLKVIRESKDTKVIREIKDIKEIKVHKVLKVIKEIKVLKVTKEIKD